MALALVATVGAKEKQGDRVELLNFGSARRPLGFNSTGYEEVDNRHQVVKHRCLMGLLADLDAVAPSADTQHMLRDQNISDQDLGRLLSYPTGVPNRPDFGNELCKHDVWKKVMERMTYEQWKLLPDTSGDKNPNNGSSKLRTLRQADEFFYTLDGKALAVFNAARKAVKSGRQLKEALQSAAQEPSRIRKLVKDGKPIVYGVIVAVKDEAPEVRHKPCGAESSGPSPGQWVCDVFAALRSLSEFTSSDGPRDGRRKNAFLNSDEAEEIVWKVGREDTPLSLALMAAYHDVIGILHAVDQQIRQSRAKTVQGLLAEP